ncbi:pyruvate kinase [Herbidospora sp. NEAU-GS84]|uniref:Phosphoenolpyruvate synthase n=1 Tax=Herbidospora solisilvae TaxID=2696284 RepID=A0A7C9JFF5_9ACTN|nr:PEP/pyruvate-binding domain-containing protein [Herbidospora solisilvae]NAS25944.1 pyruvate kinase [Herbidospora solisilvae]
MTAPVLWLSELSRLPYEEARAGAGPKMARLALLHRHGLTTPGGFVVPAARFHEFLTAGGCREVLDRARIPMSADSRTVDQTVDGLADALSAAIESTPMAADLVAQVADAHAALAFDRREADLPVAVRSSAVGEDTAEASYAGQYASRLGVRTAEGLVTAIRDCWASAFSASSIRYGLRYRAGVETAMAVGVQELVSASAAGVAFSAHPVTGDSETMVVEACWGLGETVVQGTVIPDHIVVGRDGRRLETRVSTKRRVAVIDHAAGRVRQVDMPERFTEAPVLDDERLGAVVTALLAAEVVLRHPVDVEWVIPTRWRPGDPVVLVQARPITR